MLFLSTNHTQEPNSVPHTLSLHSNTLRRFTVFGVAVVGQAELAAAHPVAYFGLIEHCVRSPHFAAADMLAAARLVGYAFAAHERLSPSDTTWFGTPGQTAVVKVLASALASVTKRAALFARQAGAMHAEQQQQPAAGSEALAAFCFPAAVSAIKEAVLVQAVSGLHWVILQK
jgi:hypothetical protein